MAARGVKQCVNRLWMHGRRGFGATQRSTAQAASTGGESRQIQPPDVPELARLAHIAVTDAEASSIHRCRCLEQQHASQRTAASPASLPRVVPGQLEVQPGLQAASQSAKCITIVLLFLLFLQVKDWAPKIEGIVDWFGQLQEVDVEGVPPALRAEVETENFLREDEPRQCAERCVALAGASSTSSTASCCCLRSRQAISWYRRNEPARGWCA
jgi:Asp-tRNA(Asn)/Glu-tRNA(Gln) amidotransferase C subunit